MKKLIFVSVLALLMIASTALSAPVSKLKWDAVTTDVDGNAQNATAYIGYCSTAQGDYTSPQRVNVGNTTETLITSIVSDTTDQRWWCVVTAEVCEGSPDCGNESVYSNEVTFTFLAGIPDALTQPACPCTLRLGN